MTLQQLLYFKTACDFYNISKASEKLCVAQPSVSLAIKSLEKEFSVQLIKRQKIGFTLTESGEKLLELAVGLLEHADALVDSMQSLKNAHKAIKIGIPPMTGAILLPDILKKLRTLCPEVNTVFSEGGKHELLRRLNDNQLDIVFIPNDGDITAKEYNCIDVARLEDVYCVSENHHFKDKKVIEIKDLAAEPLILFSDSFYHFDKIQMLFSKADISPNIIHKTSQLSTMQQFIKSGLASGFLFKEIAEQTLGVKAIPVKPPIFTKISLVWRKDTALYEDMKKIIGFFECK